MSADVRALQRTNALDYRMGVQEAKTLGPTLAEFYGQWQGLPGLRGLCIRAWSTAAAVSPTKAATA